MLISKRFSFRNPASRLFSVFANQLSLSSMSMIPSLPSGALNEFGFNLLNAMKPQVEIIEKKINEDDQDAFHQQVRKVIQNNIELMEFVRNGQLNQYEQKVANNQAIVCELLNAIDHDPVKRDHKLSGLIERFTIIKMYHSFLISGKVDSQLTLSPSNDDEYIGALFGFAQELSRYALNRACEGDIRSILMSKGLIVQMFEKMIEFDFRNGPLRRKYDGLKYCMKTIEDVAYELSLHDVDQAMISGVQDANLTSNENLNQLPSTPDRVTQDQIMEPLSKRNRNEDNDDQSVQMDNASEVVVPLVALSTTLKAAQRSSSSLSTTFTHPPPSGETNININTLRDSPSIGWTIRSDYHFFDIDCIEAIRLRMEEVDKLREIVIKDSRDVQKLSKQAIFAVIRGTTDEANKKLNLAMTIAKKILEIVKEQPLLRSGAYSGSLEEWAEGLLCLEWIRTKKILSFQEIPIELHPSEYIGGLSDFTGELGRIAVASASKRDIETVREIQQADIVVSIVINQLNVGNRFGKKLEAVVTNLKKVEEIVYELSMLKRSGRIRTKPLEINNEVGNMTDALNEG